MTTERWKKQITWAVWLLQVTSIRKFSSCSNGSTSLQLPHVKKIQVGFQRNQSSYILQSTMPERRLLPGETARALQRDSLEFSVEFCSAWPVSKLFKVEKKKKKTSERIESKKKKKPGAHTGSKVVLSPTVGMENLTINKALGRLLRSFLHSLWEKN